MTEPEVRAAVFAAAEQQDPPTWMVLRQVQIESGFNPAAVSAIGALGVAQILPSTGEHPGFGVPPVTPAALRDPSAATAFLCRYLTAMRRDESVGAGHWSRALLKYNVGPGGDVRTASSAYKELARYVAIVESEPCPC